MKKTWTLCSIFSLKSNLTYSIDDLLIFVLVEDSKDKIRANRLLLERAKSKLSSELTEAKIKGEILMKFLWNLTLIVELERLSKEQDELALNSWVPSLQQTLEAVEQTINECEDVSGIVNDWYSCVEISLSFQ
jgi:hypothetical protein